MALGFENRKTYQDSYIRDNMLMGFGSENLTKEQSDRIFKIKNYWNFYEGYHWERVPSQDGIEMTVNYCRVFVDKLVAFELGNGFNLQLKSGLADLQVNSDGQTLYDYLDTVWKDNHRYQFCTELGQVKSVTGEVWVQVSFIPPEDLEDPFGEYPNGRIKLSIMPTQVMFPTYNPHEKGKIDSLTVMYSYKHEFRRTYFGRMQEEWRVFKQIWTKDTVTTIDGKSEPVTQENKYGFIPFVQINNLPVALRNSGKSDLEDVIPVNVEYNLKQSNVSEIIDYHSAPVTILYGAKVGNLEKGANKLWGGLPKDARVENLQMQGELGAASTFISGLKQSMCELAGIPEGTLGSNLAISNTSGVALQYMNLPLIERTKVKRAATEVGLEILNKMILTISLLEGLIVKDPNVLLKDFLWNEVTIPSTLPKDMLLEIQQIQQEVKLGLESRVGAMKRLGKENIDELIKQIDEDKKANPEFYGLINNQSDATINSGFTNGETPIETVRKEMTGENGNQNH